mmetsp:Transcript_65902/g.185483  ORF Transcript_65902/g.185483 Transcript_65902/m.185483 type:complete len:275 (+) Transcript_65902:60-884(+)
MPALSSAEKAPGGPGSMPLAARLGNDALAGSGAAVALSPFVCTIDKSIISNASGRQPLVPCLQENFRMLFTRPHQFLMLREFRLILGVYSATYISANWTDSLCRHHFDVNPMWPVLVVTTAVNMTTCIAKDKAFTQMFGTKAASRLPLLTYLLFAVRDSLTVFASFSLVPVVGDWIASRSRQMSQDRAKQAAQLTCPMGMQFLSTPLHLYALNLYNAPTAGVADHAAFIRKVYVQTVSARIARIAPAFGFGGIGNTYFRQLLGNVPTRGRAAPE